MQHLVVSIDAVTPGEYKTLGQDLLIEYGFVATPFGECLLATTQRGVCFLGFVAEGLRESALKALRQTWGNASFQEQPEAVSGVVDKIFCNTPSAEEPIKVLLHGTNFQLKVWQALLRIPTGAATSYGNLSNVLGHPGASRAVGNAVGANPVAYLIPCHRVLRASGEIGGYRWGTSCKKAILAMEAAMGEEGG